MNIHHIPGNIPPQGTFTSVPQRGAYDHSYPVGTYSHPLRAYYHSYLSGTYHYAQPLGAYHYVQLLGAYHHAPPMGWTSINGQPTPLGTRYQIVPDDTDRIKDAANILSELSNHDHSKHASAILTLSTFTAPTEEARTKKKNNVGRWNSDEDKLFLDAIRKHGLVNWQILADSVCTRTKTQCRTHYQKACKSKEYKEAFRYWKAGQVKTGDKVSCLYMGIKYDVEITHIDADKNVWVYFYNSDYTTAIYSAYEWRNKYQLPDPADKKRKRDSYAGDGVGGSPKKYKKVRSAGKSGSSADKQIRSAGKSGSSAGKQVRSAGRFDPKYLAWRRLLSQEMRVKVCFADQKWFPGTIKRDRNVISVKFDDGDSIIVKLQDFNDDTIHPL